MRVKTLPIPFFDSKGLVHYEYVPYGQTVNALFYLSVLTRVFARIRRERRSTTNPGVGLCCTINRGLIPPSDDDESSTLFAEFGTSRRCERNPDELEKGIILKANINK